MQIDWHAISHQLSQQLQQDCQFEDSTPVSGGCINQAYIMRCSGQAYFVKLNQPQLESMFSAELAGLSEMYDSHTIRVPQPFCAGSTKQHAFIVMEALTLGGHSPQSMQQLAHNLAALHRQAESSHRYGWSIDNTIGSTPQINRWQQDWIKFWREQRLGFQLRLAADHGYRGKLQQSGEQLMAHLDAFFPTAPLPVMLHGDLWSGNYALLKDGTPVIFDPAFYYGDRESDIAMTELFGGFPASFYQAYNEVYPLPPEYSVRKTFYNLYHIINHLNLFGSSYLGQAESMLQRLLSEVR